MLDQDKLLISVFFVCLFVSLTKKLFIIYVLFSRLWAIFFNPSEPATERGRFTAKITAILLLFSLTDPGFKHMYFFKSMRTRKQLLILSTKKICL